MVFHSRSGPAQKPEDWPSGLSERWLITWNRILPHKATNRVRRSLGRVRTWTVAHSELERERTRVGGGWVVSQFDSPCDRHENQCDYPNSKRYQLPVTQLLFHLGYADLILRGFSADASNVIVNVKNLDNWRTHYVLWCEYSENQITSPPDRECNHFPKP